MFKIANNLFQLILRELKEFVINFYDIPQTLTCQKRFHGTKSISMPKNCYIDVVDCKNLSSLSSFKKTIKDGNVKISLADYGNFLC